MKIIVRVLFVALYVLAFVYWIATWPICWLAAKAESIITLDAG